jgi:hypothetical protein
MAAKRTRKKTIAPSAMDAAFAPIVDAFRHDEKISLARMFGSDGLKINGKVFVMMVKGDLVAKLPKERVAALISARLGEHFDPGHGRAMKEWIVLKPKERTQWLTLAKEAQQFVSSTS